MRWCARALLFFAALGGFTLTARGQAPAGAEHLSHAAIVESLAVLKTLSDQVKKRYNDPAAWYRQGMIAWALNERCRRQPTYSVLDCTRTRLLADTALMIAGELEPGNSEYASAFNRFLLASEGTFRREAPYLDRLFRSTLGRMRQHPDPIKHADGAIEAGQLYWLRYDGVAHGNSESTPSVAVTQALMKDAPVGTPPSGRSWITRDMMQQARARLDERKSKQFSGEGDYVRAEAYFREAYDAAPTYLRAFQHVARLIAERNRWSELNALATDRVRRVPGDAWAWMTRGLATYRRGDKSAASTAFDSAFVYLTSAERDRLTRVHRVLDSRQRMIRDDPVFRAREGGWNDSTFWALADPLWSRSDDDPRLEFLARITYADLVWSSEQLREHGADSDRGVIYVRWGPPDRIVSLRDDQSGSGNQYGSIYWEYDDPTRDNSAKVFRFNRIPSYRTLAFAYDDIPPPGPRALWDNLVAGRIDTIPVQVARFRAGDSVDVFLAAQPEVDAIRRASDVAGIVRTDFWVATIAGVPIVHDSIVGNDAGQRQFTARMAPDRYMYRTEATGSGARTAGRATSTIRATDDSTTGFALRGFGLSDIVLATAAESRTPIPARWTDIVMSPLLGLPKPRDELALVWETYGLTPSDGKVRYDVVISLRADGRILVPSPTGKGPPTLTAQSGASIGARIINGIAGAFGIDRRVVGSQIELAFSRELPASETVVENIAVALGDTPPGPYQLIVTTTDRATGKSTKMSRRLFVRLN